MSIKNPFLITRRVVQITILILFVLGNYSLLELRKHQGKENIFVQNTPSLEVDGSILSKEQVSTILSGDLSFSKVFGVIPLADPFTSLQLFLAGGILAFDVWLGVLLIVLFYGIFVGRAYCAYVCPVNLLTDFAAYLRSKLGLNSLKGIFLPRGFKYAVLVCSLILSVLFAIPAFESINPISALHRGLIFGMGFGILGILAIFFFDLFVLRHGFCGYVCPVGAAFSLIGKFALLRVKHDAKHCSKCMKCLAICPEKQVLDMVGKESRSVDSMACLRCGRCIEVCEDDALNFTFRREK